jgi:two-component system chemotaxis sensor kinase CheA
MQEEIKAFILEGIELLDQFESDLVSLESTTPDPAIVARIFRAAHTIKGTAGMLGFGIIDAVAHAGETYLAAVREGRARVDQTATNALLAMSDRLRAELVSVESTGAESGAEYQELLRTLEGIMSEGEAAQASPPPQTSTRKKSSARKRRDGSAATGTPPPPPTPTPSTVVTPAPGGSVRAVPSGATDSDADKRSEEPMKAVDIPGGAGPSSAPEPSSAAESAASSVHVSVEVLDNLINLVGELVLVRNRMLSMPEADKAAVGGPAVQQLDAIASFLQEEVMKTRMQPIGSMWARMPRMVRDVAVACGKNVELHMEGAETELDRTVLEAIHAPLTHLVRNAVDHGIESPRERGAAGKSPAGQLALRAYHRSGQVVISVSDDGKGIDVERLRRAATEKGFLTVAQAGGRSDREIMDLIFVSGVSTAQTVTKVSGRGVGMDVARANMARLGGSVDVTSELGKGTTVELRIPLTLTIVPALIVSIGAQRFAIPQTNVAELLHPGNEEGDSVCTERIGSSAVLRHRGSLIPVVDMNELLGLPAVCDGEDDGSDMVVLHAHDQRFAAIVDRVLDSQEIVVKPLDERIGSLGLFSGATILGDGTACLIIDTIGLAKKTGVTAEARAMSAAETRERQPEARTSANPVLLLGGADDGRLVMPLENVVHLSRIDASRVEYAAGRKVLQYQDGILPLVSIAELLPERRVTPRHESAPRGEGDDEQVCVVICSDGTHTGGLLVERIIDVVNAPAVALHAASRPGVKGTLILDGRVCEMLDVRRILEATAE